MDVDKATALDLMQEGFVHVPSGHEAALAIIKGRAFVAGLVKDDSAVEGIVVHAFF